LAMTGHALLGRIPDRDLSVEREAQRDSFTAQRRRHAVAAAAQLPSRLRALRPSPLTDPHVRN